MKPHPRQDAQDDLLRPRLTDIPSTARANLAS